MHRLGLALLGLGLGLAPGPAHAQEPSEDRGTFAAWRYCYAGSRFQSLTTAMRRGLGNAEQLADELASIGCAHATTVSVDNHAPLPREISPDLRSSWGCITGVYADGTELEAHAVCARSAREGRRRLEAVEARLGLDAPLRQDCLGWSRAPAPLSRACEG
mgnify:CR=1 FL=1